MAISVDLGKKLEEAVSELVSSGRYGSKSEVLRSDRPRLAFDLRRDPRLQYFRTTHGTQCVPKASRRLSCVAGFLTPRKSFAENTSKLFRPGTAANLRLCRDWVDQCGIIILRRVDACADFVRDH